MDFEPYFKVHNLVSVQPKSIILGQITNLNMIFRVVVSVYRLVKIRNSPQFPDEFRNGLLATLLSYLFCDTEIVSSVAVYACHQFGVRFLPFSRCL